MFGILPQNGLTVLLVHQVSVILFSIGFIQNNKLILVRLIKTRGLWTLADTRKMGDSYADIATRIKAE